MSDLAFATDSEMKELLSRLLVDTKKELLDDLGKGKAESLNEFGATQDGAHIKRNKSVGKIVRKRGGEHNTFFKKLAREDERRKRRA